MTLTASPVISLADFCDRPASDLVTCSSRGFLAAELGGRVQVNDSWSIGPFSWFGFEMGSRGEGTTSTPLRFPGQTSSGSITTTTFTSQLGGIGVVAHYHPYGGGFWLAPRAGALLLRDIADEQVNGGEATRSSTYQWGLEVGGGLGYDWRVVDSFAFTLGLRAAQAVFPQPEAFPREGGSTVSSGPLVVVNVGGWFGLE